jgi:replicative DNA helicase
MAEKSLCSEGTELDDVIDDLQREQRVKEVTGWDSGFANLNGVLDGIRPGLHLLIGAPGIGKTSFARQLLDQIAERNGVPSIFFSFVESKKELRIKTLARLSGLDNREIRRGSAYVLHWYGVPRLASTEAAALPPSWEKLKRMAEQAKHWLDSVYLIECDRRTGVEQIEAEIRELSARLGCEPLIVIDDCQRLGPSDQPPDSRLSIVSEQLQALAKNFKTPLVATWPELEENNGLAQRWSERIPGADVVLVMQTDAQRTQKLTEPNQAIVLHIVKNRGGEKGKLAYEFFPGSSSFKQI